MKLFLFVCKEEEVIEEVFFNELRVEGNFLGLMSVLFGKWYGTIASS